jgi:DNA repair protein RecN (Recombination protein N)
MLLELRIENLLLIERAELRLGEGLNVITGETGAGKTVLAHSLDLLLGGKPRSGIVRPGAEEAWVEGCFALPERLREDPELGELLERVPDGEEVVLARRVAASGRSAAFLAGRAASAADLRTLGPRLLAFYGQHEHRRLTLASVQAEVLDAHAGADHLELREAYSEVHSRVSAIERELSAIQEREGARERDLDLLRFELDEIDELSPDPAEHADLLAERGRLRGVEGLREGAAAALHALAGAEDGEGGAVALLGEAETALARASGVDPKLDAVGSRAAALGVELADVAAELRSCADGLEADPERLQAVEERLDAVDRLLRKHGGSIEAVLEHADRCRSEIARLEGAGERIDSLEAELGEFSERRAGLGEKLTASRKAASGSLEKELTAALGELAMEGARVEVELRPHPEGFGPGGRETVELRVATNPGLPPGPLGDIASGGELSRVMLALAALGAAGEPATLVFDEIDAGVGGRVARSVGERLRSLGREHQVVCITHLPQVASLADAHFRVHKSAAGQTALAAVDRVEGEELVGEIVRMLGAAGDDETAEQHARELLAA